MKQEWILILEKKHLSRMLNREMQSCIPLYYEEKHNLSRFSWNNPIIFLRHGLVYRGNIWSNRKRSLSVMSQKLPRARIWHFLIRDSSWSHREDQACLENNQSCNWQGITTNKSATPFKINRKFKSTLVLVTASVNLSTLPLVCTTRTVQSTQGKVYFFLPFCSCCLWTYKQ